MQYAGLIKNDIAAAPGVSVSLYVQGCPHHCPGCHNPQTWDFKGGKEFTFDTLNEIIEALQENGIKHSLSILGGEPLCPENQFLTSMVIRQVREKLPDVKIYLWTGYEYDKLSSVSSQHLDYILKEIDCIIDGPYVEAERDISLPLRGSRNQNVIYFDKTEKI